MKRKHAASEGDTSHLPVKKPRSQQPWYQHLKNFAETEGMVYNNIRGENPNNELFL